MSLGDLSISVLTILAGFPAAIELGGTSFVTIELAATIELSPIVTPLLILAFDPTHTLRPIVTGLESE
jgi:hypothetical protein